jgi:peptide/nickel transport system substrate-binding protein
MQESEYWRRFYQKRLSRRTALKAGATGLGAAALALAGCAGGSNNQSSGGGGNGAVDAFLTPAAPEGQPVYGGHQVLPWNSAFGGLDVQESVDWYGSAMFHGYLHDINLLDNRKVHLQFADSLEQPDHVTYVWKLKQGVKFQNVDPMNGREVTADDVVYSYTRRRDDPKSQNDKQFLRDYVDHFEAADKYTFRLVTKAPYSPALDEMGNSSYAIVPHDAVEKWGDLMQHGVGMGPFIAQDFSRGEKLTFVKNPDFYMEGLPYVDSGEVLIITDDSTMNAAFKNGKLDSYWGQPNRPKVDDWKNIKGIDVRTGPNYWHRAVMMKVDEAPFNDVRVRQAVDLTIDRQDLIDKLAFGYGKYAGPCVPDLTPFGLPQDELKAFYKVDVEKAKQLLADAGYPNGLDVELKVENVSDLAKMAQVVAQQLSKANIRVTITLQELGLFLAQTMYARNFKMMLYYNLPYEEPDRPLCQWFSKGQAGFSFSGYSDATADDWVNKERAEFDPDARTQIILDAQRYFLTQYGPQINGMTDVGYGASWSWTHGEDENIGRGTGWTNLNCYRWLTEKKV